MITEEQIRRKAFQIYKQRIRLGIAGTAETDWEEAKAELEESEMVGDNDGDE